MSMPVSGPLLGSRRGSTAIVPEEPVEVSGKVIEAE
jgi:hypothetical protein